MLPEKSTVTAIKYRAQLCKIASEVAKKRLIPGQVYFEHDNEKTHVGKVVKEKLAELGLELLPHPPYSPDLAPSDYHLFRSLNNDLRGKSFQNESDLKRYLQDFFNSKSREFFANGIRDLPRRWQEVIDSNGKYIVKK